MVGSDLSVSELKPSTRKDRVRKNSKIFLCEEKLKPSGLVLCIDVYKIDNVYNNIIVMCER